MFVATLVDVNVAVGVGDGVNVAVGAGVSDLVNVGVAVRVSVLVSVTLGVRVGSSVGEFVAMGDEMIDRRVCVGNCSLLLHPVSIHALNDMSRIRICRMKFLSDDYGAQLQQRETGTVVPILRVCGCSRL